MPTIETIAEQVRQAFEARTAARDQALAQTRLLTRHCSNAIRAVHREEWQLAEEHIAAARAMSIGLRSELTPYPDLYYSGYTQDALKEYAEACLTYALVRQTDLPTPADLEIEHATYMQGMAEAASELRRRCMDLLRHGHSAEVERLLGMMDDIYSELVTMDYPDGVTGGLRRLTDLLRGVTERTRGDITISMRQEQLERALQRLEDRLDAAEA
jgi:translin